MFHRAEKTVDAARTKDSKSDEQMKSQRKIGKTECWQRQF